MPKGRSRKRKEKPSAPIDSASPDEDSESVTSSLDGCSVVSEEGGCLSTREEGRGEEDMEFYLTGHLDLLSEKNSRVRLEALSAINKCLTGKVVPECLVDRKETVLDVILKGLKKAQGVERCGLARLAMLLVAQLGLDHVDLLKTLFPVAAQLTQDHTVPSAERAEVITMLGFTTFVQAADFLEVEHTMTLFEELMRKSKDSQVVWAAVKNWTFLLSIAPPHAVPAFFTSLLPVLNKLLEWSDLNVRVAVGTCIALLFELARDGPSECEELLDSEDSSHAYSTIQQLATESDRHTTRKDRNHTRSCFRDILLSLDDGDVPERSVKVGLEVLLLNSWGRLCQYNAFKDLLSSGLTCHLKRNEVLRDIFQMGPVPLQATESKAARLEKKYWNAAVAKYRTQSRGKQRDKRAVL